MSVYMTEDEQLEVMKKWWNRYGNLVTVVLSLCLLVVAGYRYMNWHHDKVTQQASMTYENMMDSLSKHNSKAVRSYANELIKDYNHSIYADAAHMTLAKLFVSQNKLDQAKDELLVVAKNSKMNAFKQIAKIRLARILADGKSYSNALNELSVIDDKTYLPVINELRADIYSATGKYQEAITAYRLAIAEVKTNGMVNLFLEMKTNELAMKTQSKLSDDNKMQTT